MLVMVVLLSCTICSTNTKKMYGVVEFEGRKCAVVPLNWLTDNQQKCFWPKTATSHLFDKMVQACKEPTYSWPKYVVIKVIQIAADYDNANNILRKAIDDSSSSDTGDIQQLLNVFEPNATAEEEEPANNNNKVTEEGRHEKASTSVESSSDFSSEDDTPLTVNGTVISHKTSLRSDSTTITVGDGSSTIISSHLASPSTSSSSMPPNCLYLLETIIRKVEHVANTQDQHMLMLNKILSLNQSASAVSFNKPSDMPNLPVMNKPEYKAFETFLKSQEKFNYMKCRLACIGGTSVRNATMNVMKFIIADKVAMKFNWAGRDQKKKAFKDTLMSKVVQEAVMTAYSKHGTSDVSDKGIQDAMKDWLKLAKHRFDNKAKKMRLH